MKMKKRKVPNITTETYKSGTQNSIKQSSD